MLLESICQTHCSGPLLRRLWTGARTGPHIAQDQCQRIMKTVYAMRCSSSLQRVLADPPLLLAPSNLRQAWSCFSSEERIRERSLPPVTPRMASVRSSATPCASPGLCVRSGMLAGISCRRRFYGCPTLGLLLLLPYWTLDWVSGKESWSGRRRRTRRVLGVGKETCWP